MYGKFFESTFTGSMYGRGPVVFSVWAYAIAHTKPDGMVELNPAMLAGMIGCETKDIEAAIEFLCLPDPRSRSKTMEGRRLVREGEYIYKTVNYSVYNSVRNEPQRREYNRIKKRESRARIAAGQTMSNHPVKSCQARQPTHTHTHTHTQKERILAPTEPAEFSEIRAAYPKRAGANPWGRALKACRARISEGHSWQELIEAAARYRAFCVATGKEGTEYVMLAATFFGPEKHITLLWTPPPSKAELQQGANVSAAQAWLLGSA